MKVRLLAMAAGFVLAAGAAWAGPTPGGVDSDGDTVENAFDNCLNVSNTAQTDTNHFGCGDACTQTITCDFNGDKIVGTPDFLILKSHIGQSVPPHTNGDCNGDGLVGTPDFLQLKGQIGHTVGPSGITTAQCDNTKCRCTPQ